jgi:hypothetical protein
MLPYFVYMCSVLYYFTYYITGVSGPPDSGFFGGSAANNTLRCVILITTLIFLVIEYFQFLLLGKAYFTDKWNWLNLASYILNISIVFIHVSDTDYDRVLLA